MPHVWKGTRCGQLEQSTLRRSTGLFGRTIGVPELCMWIYAGHSDTTRAMPTPGMTFSKANWHAF